MFLNCSFNNDLQLTLCGQRHFPGRLLFYETRCSLDVWLNWNGLKILWLTNIAELFSLSMKTLRSLLYLSIFKAHAVQRLQAGSGLFIYITSWNLTMQQEELQVSAGCNLLCRKGRWNISWGRVCVWVRDFTLPCVSRLAGVAVPVRGGDKLNGCNICNSSLRVDCMAVGGGLTNIVTQSCHPADWVWDVDKLLAGY